MPFTDKVKRQLDLSKLYVNNKILKVCEIIEEHLDKKVDKTELDVKLSQIELKEGPQGPPGTGIKLENSVPTYSELPNDLTDSEEDKGKAFYNEADGFLYFWDGKKFPEEGKGSQFKGDKGDTGTSPHIGVNDNWWVGPLDLGKTSRGLPGHTPSIGANGNWVINGNDQNKPSRGEPGLAHYIGPNGNWWFDGMDTGEPSRGPPGEVGRVFDRIYWTPTGYPANCVSLIRIGNTVTFMINMGTTNAPTTLTTNSIPNGYKPPIDMPRLFAGMSSNGKESFIAINADGRIQASISNAAPVNAAFTWVTKNAYPDEY